MKTKISNLIKLSLRIGYFEKKILKHRFKVYTPGDINAFLLQLSEDEFIKFYECRLPKLLNKEDEKGIISNILKCLTLSYREDRKEEYQITYQSIIEQIRELDIYTYSLNRWRTLSEFFISNGMFQLGEICRQKAIENILNRKHRLGDNWRKIPVLLEKREFDKADNLIKKIEKNPIVVLFLKEEIGLLKQYYKMLTKDNGSSEILDGNEKFAQLVQGKDLVIIGPAQLRDGFPFEDKDYVVIRNNESREADDESYQAERKTDITYYNYEGGVLINKKKDTDFFKQFKYIVSKNGVKWDTKIENVRELRPMNSMLFIGTFNMLPIMILDLYQFDVKNLYVCGNNLYLTATPWNSKYLFSAQNKMKEWRLWRSFSIHHMFSQLMFIKNIYLSQQIIVDKELEKVLMLTPMEYAKEMEKIHVFSVND